MGLLCLRISVAKLQVTCHWSLQPTIILLLCCVGRCLIRQLSLSMNSNTMRYSPRELPSAPTESITPSSSWPTFPFPRVHSNSSSKMRLPQTTRISVTGSLPNPCVSRSNLHRSCYPETLNAVSWSQCWKQPLLKLSYPLFPTPPNHMKGPWHCWRHGLRVQPPPWRTPIGNPTI